MDDFIVIYKSLTRWQKALVIASIIAGLAFLVWYFWWVSSV